MKDKPTYTLNTADSILPDDYMDEQPESANTPLDENRTNSVADLDSDISDSASLETALPSPEKNSHDFEEIREIEALSHLENSRLLAEYAVAAETNDAELVKKIKWRIVLANIPLIYRIAWPIFKRFKCIETGFEIGDLVSLGYEGVLRAIITFDSSKGFAFGTYAGWWIRNYIVRYVHDNDRTMRLP
ncbi:MAG: sigma factor, partial [Pseudomonadota bacterium]